MTCKVRHLSLPNQNVHALLAGLRLVFNRPARACPALRGPIQQTEVQNPMMDLTGLYTTVIFYNNWWVSFKIPITKILCVWLMPFIILNLCR